MRKITLLPEEKILTTLDYETDDIFCVKKEQYTVIEFLSFLEKVNTCYSMSTS